MQYLWKIVKIWEIETVGQNAMQKQTIVLEEVTDKDYKGGIAFDLIKDKVKLSDWLNVWDTVEVSLNFRVSEYNGRHYNNVNAWKIEKQQSNDVDVDDILPF